MAKDTKGSPLGAAHTDLHEIPIACLREDTQPDFAIYIVPGPGKPPVLYRERDLVMDRSAIDRLESNSIRTIFIADRDWAAFRFYLESHLPLVLANPDVQRNTKAALVYDTAQGLMQDVINEPRSKALVARSKELVAHMTAFLKREQGMLEELIKVASFDYYTYTHSVNVFVFSNALARAAGITDDAVLREFGVGTLLHDIGKSQMDPAVINSRGRLTEEQWQQMRMHPVWGWEIAKEHGGFGDMALDIIRHHHEKLTGGGYPDGLKGDRLSKFVRISTICDIFDALTTRRSYKQALDTFPAFKLMQDQMIAELDPALFALFVKIMAAPGKH